ncbi:Octanoyltransferase [Hondaea fermentalgiana]|uniref:lipoyl(octanoyl) transferase n=1 Tax=Hondaea fermentalgiana TaxID=2315210 RepID=A0A2R5GQ79_9STRA|nr:Octanoyltransferase [Hondaea fermentalgiana]|eukprot:GBG32765.1 Octanoyltransferase [Hondaea fermentalgiana]
MAGAMRGAMRALELVHVAGRCSYAEGLGLQRAAMNAKLAALREGHEMPRDRLFLLEHEPVYTLGRSADVANVLSGVADGGFDLVRVDRGGEVTFHGPGQIVGYPVLDLRAHTKDLHWYMRQVEEVIIATLATYGLEGSRKEEYTGVWVDDAKVCAIGLNASRWITSHGFALNVTTDLEAFSRIVPCGIDDPALSVTSIEALLGSGVAAPSRMEVQERLVKEFMRIFTYDRLRLTKSHAAPVESEIKTIR